MYIMVDAVQSIMDDITKVQTKLRTQYEGTHLSMTEQDHLSMHHTEGLNEYLKSKYPFVRNDMARVNISTTGIFVSVNVGGL